MRAVIVAGGQGLRMRPLTAARPKAMLPLLGAPFAVGLVRRLAGAGIREVTVLVSGADMRPWQPLADAGAEILAEDVPLGTAGGLRRQFARRPPDGPVFVCNGDVLTAVDPAALLAAHLAAGAVATVAIARVDRPSAFGVLVRDERGWIRSAVEKPQPGTELANTVNIGSYVLGPATFADLPGDGPLAVEHHLMPALAAAGTLLGVLVDGYWQDLGTPARYRDAHRAVLAGAVPWPVPPGMVLAAGSAVHASARVSGTVTGSVVGAGCVIGVGAAVVGSVLDEAVRVGLGARVVDCVLGPGLTVSADLTGAVLA